MQSFRTEIENPIVEKDILELERKIQLFKEGKIDEERFRSLRLARGVYGQRQFGVQMIRIKLPYGKVSSEQLHRISDVSDEYSRGRLHITTRQDIQIHHVSLDRTPELWAQLEKDDITLREACGNAVRNITASETAGIDTAEPFDVSPYADATFKFFLRNPICQEMGRKFKMSFSGTDDDTAISFIHDLGFIAKIKIENGVAKKGFKVLLGGGLGSQPRQANEVFSFLEADRMIPFSEAVIRVFDRHGERNKRNKARLKFLVKEIGLTTFLEWVAEEENSLLQKTYPIAVYDRDLKEPLYSEREAIKLDTKEFNLWKKTNLFKQKQAGYFSVGLPIEVGDISSSKARELAKVMLDFTRDDNRFSLGQSILLRDVEEGHLPALYTRLKEINLHRSGFHKLNDIVACPGTDTCNLGIASSTGIAAELERVIAAEYPQYLENSDLVIKISGCMNACGQHNMASIGFQGMTVKANENIAPATQILLGGGVLGNGTGRFADKVLKVPAKRTPEVLRLDS